MKNLKLSRKVLAWNIGLLGMGYVAGAHSAGFQLFEQSVSGLGTSFASTAAAEDASTVWWNPAGMSYLQGTNFSLAGHAIKPSAEFKNDGSRTFIPPPIGIPLSGGNGGDAGGIAIVPNLYFTHAFTDRLSFGVGINSPFGLTTEYDDGWVGRYHALKSDLLTVNINPSVAWKINERFSLGGGVSIQYAKAELSSAVDFSTVCLGAAPPATCAALGLATPGNTARDGKATVDGDHWGYGFNLGAMWQIVPSTRLGFAYRSSISQNLSGDAKFDNVPAAFTANPNFQNRNVTASVDLPDTASLNVYSQIDQSWAVMADLTWTKWSRFEELRVKSINGAADILTTEKWDDSFRVAVGANYKPTEKWTLRAGLAYDQSPVPDQYRTPRIPDQDRTWVSFGANWKITQNGSLDFGYAHIFVKSASVNLSTADAENQSRGNLKGSYDKPSVDILSIQYNHHF
ncbi:MAG: outer membrane protein transport protein [Burkholderiales bacterium]